MTKNRAKNIVQYYVMGATLRTISEMYGKHNGMQFEGEDLVKAAIKKLKLVADDVDFAQTRVLEIRTKAFEHMKFEMERLTGIDWKFNHEDK